MKVTAIALAVLLGLAASTHAQPVLTIQGNRFAVNGTQKFLVFASVFAATSASRVSDGALEEWFSYLASKQVDGVRIFPNWWKRLPCLDYNAYDPSNLMVDGTAPYINEAAYNRLVYVLGRAAAWGLVVDISFARETVRPLSKDSFTMAKYQVALAEVARRLRYQAPHAFIDLQNEANGQVIDPVCPSSKFAVAPGEVYGLLAAVKQQDPARYVTIDVANEMSPESYGEAAATAWTNPANPNQFYRFDLAAYHDPRTWSGTTPKWAGFTGAAIATALVSQAEINVCSTPASPNPVGKPGCNAMRVERLKGKLAQLGTPMPVYFQEPDRWMPSGVNASLNAGQLREAVTRAKYAGAAAWCFHSQASFLLENSPQPLSGVENDFLSTYRTALNAYPWNP